MAKGEGVASEASRKSSDIEPRVGASSSGVAHAPGSGRNPKALGGRRSWNPRNFIYISR